MYVILVMNKRILIDLLFDWVQAQLSGLLKMVGYT